jgi:hypothetical protein
MSSTFVNDFDGMGEEEAEECLENEIVCVGVNDSEGSRKSLADHPFDGVCRSLRIATWLAERC